jgi:hypothetical protein
VKKGESGIRILAPLIRKVDEEKNGTIENVSRPFGFRAVRYSLPNLISGLKARSG